MNATGMVKGALLLERMSYVRVMGPMMADRILSRIPSHDRELLDGLRQFPPAFMYPSDLLQRLEEAVAAEVANGDRARVLADMGQFAADHNFGPTGALHRWIDEGDPHALLRELPQIHAALFGSGEHAYERLGERSAAVRTLEGDGHEGDGCLATTGWLRRAIELCGGRDVEVAESTCLGRGGRCCEFRCDWR